MDLDQLRQELSVFLRLSMPEMAIDYTLQESVPEDGYRRLRITYIDDEEVPIPAFLLMPDGNGPFCAVLVHHQHNSQRHFGKSEVCGLVGDPLQAFGPALAKQGIVVLAPDSICFEDRRKNRTGTEADESSDVAQHFNEMCYRLVRGDTLMRKVLSDSARAISVLRAHPLVDPNRIGILGHSYGGNTVLFHGALDERIRFGCSSGAACSYQYKLRNHIGIEMAEAIPGFAKRFDIADLLACFTPRPILIVSATQDVFSQDADRIVTSVKREYPGNRIDHRRFQGGHALTQERFNEMMGWLVQQVTVPPL